jgi:uncharacterized protein with HXXEE motif
MPAMSFQILILLLPLVVALHNADEYRRYEEFARIYFRRGLLARLVSRTVLRNALTFVTFAVVVLCVWSYISRTEMLLIASRVAIFALGVNAVGHCLLSATRRSLTPGTVSAALVALPYSVVAVITMRVVLGDSLIALVSYACLGVVTVPLAVVASILVGFGISRLAAAIQLHM